MEKYAIIYKTMLRLIISLVLLLLFVSVISRLIFFLLKLLHKNKLHLNQQKKTIAFFHPYW